MLYHAFCYYMYMLFLQTESVITVKEFLKDMTVAELHSVFCVGFGTISGGVMALYVAFGVSRWIDLFVRV